MLGNEELRSKNGVGWSQKLRMAEVILNIVTGKRLENGQRLEEGASLGLFSPNPVEARDRSQAVLKAL